MAIATQNRHGVDFIRRNLLTSGELSRLIREDGLRGMTSNPTIFEKAISSGDEYDAAIKKHASKSKTTQALFESIAVEDIQKACDLWNRFSRRNRSQQ